MTVKEFIRKQGWVVECETKPCRWMEVNISFENPQKKEDETSFDIHAYNVDELTNLFMDFCKENEFPFNTVTSITIVAMASTYEELEKKVVSETISN